MPNISNISLVAFYGDKPPKLITIIHKLQNYLCHHQLIRGQFIPYKLEQVHGTIIGCEGFQTEWGIVSKWLYEHKQKTEYIDIVGLVNYLQHQTFLPLTIRIGGYDRTLNYNFHSRGQHPYIRSFQLQPAENKTIPVLIGWTWQGDRISLELDNLRRSFERFNLLHKYHADFEAIDNDFYLRLGTINNRLTPQQINTIATDIRKLLETDFIQISINKDNLALVQYQDLSLTPETTKITPIANISETIVSSYYNI